MPTKLNPWCPYKICDEYKAPEQMCPVCLEVYRARKQGALEERKRCVQALQPLSLQSCGCYQEAVKLIRS